MAGRPKQRMDMVKLDMVQKDDIVEMLQQGMSIVRICYALGVGRKALDAWLDMPENAELASRARARAATDLACETLEIADSATPEAANVAKIRIASRQWLAERWNAPVYAQQRAPAVNISIGGLRLDALRHVEVVQDADNVQQVCG